MSQPTTYHLAHLWIELTRGLHKAMAGDAQARFGARVGSLLIIAAVYLGTVEQRPMTASKLAAYIGMPRATIIRQLRLLCRRGAIERDGSAYRLAARQRDLITMRDSGDLARLVRTTLEKLGRPRAH